MASIPDSPTLRNPASTSSMSLDSLRIAGSGRHSHPDLAPPDFHVDFNHGPDIELRPLTTPDTRADSVSLADTKPVVSNTIEDRGQWRRFLEDWGWETAACLLSLGGFLGIVGLLKAFDGKAQPSWPYGITLNSAIAVLSTVTKGLLLVPAAACISQSIWISYAQSAHPLRTLTAYDAASRGPLGALNLIWRLRAQRLACLGAGLIILAVGVGPTVQQTIVVGTRSIPTTQPASIPRARSFINEIVEETNSVWNWVKSDIVPTEMIGHLYSGMYHGSTGSKRSELDVVPVCPTNDCAFPNFESLAVCSSCLNITQKMEQSCFTVNNNVTQCTFSLPNGLKANQSTRNPDTLAASAVLAPIEGDNNNYRVGKSLHSDSIGNILVTTILNASSNDGIISADAHQCSLSWCVKTYEAKVVNGSLEEREVQSRVNWDWLIKKAVDARVFSMESSSQGGPNGPAFAVYEPASIKISNWLLYKFTFSNSKYLINIRTLEDQDLYWFMEDATSNFTGDARAVSHQRDTIKTMLLVGYEEVFSSVAKALTTYIRTDGLTAYEVAGSANDTLKNLGPIPPVAGTAYITEIYIKIHWRWLIFLGAILASNTAFLILTIYKSSKYNVAAWKSEPLALLYHGLEASREEEDRRLDSVRDMHQQGKRTRVQLQGTESGLKLGYADR
ncbi:hypothetical protein OPT61_g4181 [Boeremia exigua]|uniref:Uncharacterized protein n=1 Tax=Boeremia exigua TaxID=749465 RepID=A0ACC2IF60_9PLEO|nr:hypothetical protein OPT61_g4181 [Boeremia exigua]